jgi:hypothetical protein
MWDNVNYGIRLSDCASDGITFFSGHRPLRHAPGLGTPTVRPIRARSHRPMACHARAKHPLWIITAYCRSAMNHFCP